MTWPTCREQYTTLSTRWSREKELIQDIQGMKQAIETARNQADKAERQGNYEKVAELRYGTINKLEKRSGRNPAETH